MVRWRRRESGIRHHLTARHDAHEPHRIPPNAVLDDAYTSARLVVPTPATAVIQAQLTDASSPFANVPATQWLFVDLERN